MCRAAFMILALLGASAALADDARSWASFKPGAWVKRETRMATNLGSRIEQTVHSTSRLLEVGSQDVTVETEEEAVIKVGEVMTPQPKRRSSSRLPLTPAAGERFPPARFKVSHVDWPVANKKIPCTLRTIVAEVGGVELDTTLWSSPRIPGGMVKWEMLARTPGAIEISTKVVDFGGQSTPALDLTCQVEAPAFIEINHRIIVERLVGLDVQTFEVTIEGDRRDQIRIVVPYGDESERSFLRDMLVSSEPMQLNEVIRTATTEAGLGKVEPDTAVAIEVDDPKESKTGRQPYFLVRKTPELTGARIRSATVSTGPFGEPEIDVELDPQGAKKMEEISQRLLNKQLAIILGGRVYMAPVIKSRIQGRVQITGRFERATAERIVRVLKTAALPIPMKLMNRDAAETGGQRPTGPTGGR